jgi:hypothetical protein
MKDSESEVLKIEDSESEVLCTDCTALLMHTTIYLSFCLTSPRHVSASNYAIIKGALSTLHKMCANVTVQYCIVT